jgi:hypothetical protein
MEVLHSFAGKKSNLASDPDGHVLDADAAILRIRLVPDQKYNFRLLSMRPQETKKLHF